MKIKGGYILQPRIIDESETSRFPPHVREIWLYLLRKANHEDRIVHGTLIKRGQLKTSYKDILEDLSWFVGYRKESYKKHHCETAMKLLTKQQMITTAKTTRGMFVTICKYDHYQNPNNYETDNESDNKTTRDLQSTDTINKNYKNSKNSNINKEATKKNKSVAEKIDDYLSIVPEDWKESVEVWLRYKKDRKEMYKSDRSFGSFFKTIERESQGDPNIFKAAVEQSIKNNWSGVFPKKHANKHPMIDNTRRKVYDEF